MRALCAVALTLLAACERAPHRDEWTFPVALGMSRDSIGSLLGPAADSSPFEEFVAYPSSGVLVQFDERGLAAQLRFAALASAGEWIRYPSPVVFGVVPSDSLDYLVRILGPPSHIDSSQTGTIKRHIWNRSGLSISTVVGYDQEAPQVGIGTILFLDIQRSAR